MLFVFLFIVAFLIVFMFIVLSLVNCMVCCDCIIIGVSVFARRVGWFCCCSLCTLKLCGVVEWWSGGVVEWWSGGMLE